MRPDRAIRAHRALLRVMREAERLRVLLDPLTVARLPAKAAEQVDVLRDAIGAAEGTLDEDLADELGETLAAEEERLPVRLAKGGFVATTSEQMTAALGASLRRGAR